MINHVEPEGRNVWVVTAISQRGQCVESRWDSKDAALESVTRWFLRQDTASVTIGTEWHPGRASTPANPALAASHADQDQMR